MSELYKKKCVSCDGSIPAFDKSEIHKYLKKVDGWQVENNDDKILEYFDTIEKLQKNKEQKDVLKFKKALFLLKKSKNQEAKIILNELVKSDSKIKSLAEDILAD